MATNKKIRLNESEFNGLVKRIVNESLKRVLNEATPKQIAFLQRLMGSSYDPSYDSLSVSDMSQMIDQWVKKGQQSNGGNGMKLATDAQIGRLVNNKYHPLPWIMKIKDTLTFQDASEMCDVVSPYQGRTNYYYNIRTKKEDWIPRCAEVVARIARKYGLEAEAQAEEKWASDFMSGVKNKEDRRRAKMDKQELVNTPIVFVSSEDESRRDMCSKTSLYDLDCKVYMHGVVEDFFHWDIPNIAQGTDEQYFKRAIENAIQNKFSRSSFRTVRVSCRVEGYERPCYLILWYGTSHWKNGVIGLVVDKYDQESIDYANKLAQSSTYDI